MSEERKLQKAKQSSPLPTKLLIFSILIAILVIVTKKYNTFPPEEVRIVYLN